MHVDPDSRMFLSLEINISDKYGSASAETKRKAESLHKSHIKNHIFFSLFVSQIIACLSPLMSWESCFCCYVDLTMCGKCVFFYPPVDEVCECWCVSLYGSHVG